MYSLLIFAFIISENFPTYDLTALGFGKKLDTYTACRYQDHLFIASSKKALIVELDEDGRVLRRHHTPKKGSAPGKMINPVIIGADQGGIWVMSYDNKFHHFDKDLNTSPESFQLSPPRDFSLRFFESGFMLPEGRLFLSGTRSNYCVTQFKIENGEARKERDFVKSREQRFYLLDDGRFEVEIFQRVHLDNDYFFTYYWDSEAPYQTVTLDSQGKEKIQTIQSDNVRVELFKYNAQAEELIQVLQVDTSDIKQPGKHLYITSMAKVKHGSLAVVTQYNKRYKANATYIYHFNKKGDLLKRDVFKRELCLVPILYTDDDLLVDFDRSTATFIDE